MRNVLITALLLGVIGLAVGYFLFAGSAGNYIPVWRLLGISHNELQSLTNEFLAKFGGLATVRRNILISGLVGFAVGFLGALVGHSRGSGRRR